MAQIQDILIISSSVVTMIKGLVSVATYSYVSVLLAIVELGLTGTALALFVLDEANSSVQLGDERTTFILAFVLSILVEWLDVLGTYAVVGAFKELEQLVPDTKASEKRANTRFTFGLVFYALFTGVFPIVAFSQAGWEVMLFQPSKFSSANSDRMFIAFCLYTAIFSGLALSDTMSPSNVGRLQAKNLQLETVALSYFEEPEALLSVLVSDTSCCFALFLVLSGFALFAIIVLISLSLAGLSEAIEAGGFTFLFVIFSVQFIEMGAESQRLGVIKAALYEVQEAQQQPDE